MKISKSFVLLLLAICPLFSCKYQLKKLNNETITELPLSNIENEILPTIFIGKTDDLKAFKYFNLIGIKDKKSLVPDTLYGIRKDSLYMKITNWDMPQFVNLFAFGENLFNTFLFVNPGDTIFVSIKNKEIEFTGTNSSHYNFYKKLDKQNIEWPIYADNLKKYKRDCKKVFEKKKSFLKQYLETNPNVSEEFQFTLSENFKFEYLNYLIALNLDKGRELVNLNLFSSLKNKENSNISQVNYFDNITYNDFNRPDLLHLPLFYNTFLLYNRHLFINQEYENFSKEKFLQEKDFYLSKYNGDIQKFTIFRLINNYFEYNPIENGENLKQIIKEYEFNFIEPRRIEKLSKIKTTLNRLNKTFTVEVLNTEFLTIKGDTIQFRDILQKAGKRIKAIDFWASWCGPCINEIKKGNENRKELSKVNNIEWLYFSIDENRKSWLKKSKELAEFGLLKNQYLVLNQTESELILALNINSIPRYVILNEDSMLISANAPRPSQVVDFNRMIKM